MGARQTIEIRGHTGNAADHGLKRDNAGAHKSTAKHLPAGMRVIGVVVANGQKPTLPKRIALWVNVRG